MKRLSDSNMVDLALILIVVLIVLALAACGTVARSGGEYTPTRECNIVMQYNHGDPQDTAAILCWSRRDTSLGESKP